MMLQPVIKDENGTHRFYENEIVNDICRTGKNGGYILNYIHEVDRKDIDEVRHFMQMTGYSVSGFGDLQIAHADGDYDNGYDNYINIVDNIEITTTPEHPIQDIKLLTVEETGYKDFTFVANTFFVNVLAHFNINIERYLKSPVYSTEDKRQVLMLIGASFTEFFKYGFNQITFSCSGESAPDFELRAKYLDHYENKCNGSELIIKEDGVIIDKPKDKIDMTFFRHETLHTTHILNCLLYEQLIEHTYYDSKINTQFNNELDLAFKHLSKAYQLVCEEYETD